MPMASRELRGAAWPKKRKRQEHSENLQRQLDAAKAASPKAAAAADALVGEMNECNVLEGVRPGQSSGVPFTIISSTFRTTRTTPERPRTTRPQQSAKGPGPHQCFKL